MSARGALAGRLRVSAEPNDGLYWIGLAGELDEGTCPQVEAELAAARFGGAQEIIVDLTEVEFIDSSGIALLVHTLRNHRTSSCKLRVVPSTSTAVQRLLELCGLGGVLPVVESSP